MITLVGNALIRQFEGDFSFMRFSMTYDRWFVSVKQPLVFFSGFFIHIFLTASLNILGHRQSLLCGAFSIALILS